MKSSPLAVVASLLIGAAVLDAQWLNYPTPGIPRLPDGKPNLSAPAPRAPPRRAWRMFLIECDRAAVVSPMAAMRSVETKVPMIRVANTGIS